MAERRRVSLNFFSTMISKNRRNFLRMGGRYDRDCGGRFTLA
jgi:hypothetical protein